MDLYKKSKTQYKEFWLVLILVGFFSLSAILPLQSLSKELQNFLYPVNSQTRGFARNIDNTIEDLQNIGSIRSDLSRMQLENARLQNKIAELEDINSENRNLKDLVEADIEIEKSTSAAVLSDGLASNSEYLIIDSGSKSDVNEGDLVTYGGGFVGLVTEVSASTSRVQLITSIDSTYQGLLINPSEEEVSQTYKVALTGGSNGVVAENISNKANLNEDTLIYVNDERVGQRLYLGSVGNTVSDSTDSTKKIIVELPYTIYDLTYVTVIHE